VTALRGAWRALRGIYCGLCQCDHTPAEWQACIDRQAGR
jgi:hypothetical protein